MLNIDEERGEGDGWELWCATWRVWRAVGGWEEEADKGAEENVDAVDGGWG